MLAVVVVAYWGIALLAVTVVSWGSDPDEPDVKERGLKYAHRSWTEKKLLAILQTRPVNNSIHILPAFLQNLNIFSWVFLVSKVMFWVMVVPRKQNNLTEVPRDLQRNLTEWYPDVQLLVYKDKGSVLLANFLKVCKAW